MNDDDTFILCQRCLRTRDVNVDFIVVVKVFPLATAARKRGVISISHETEPRAGA